MDDEQVSVREDIGYTTARGIDMPKIERAKAEKKRIRYTEQSMMKGEVRELSVAIANDLIERGYAVPVDREPGEEG